MSTLGEFKKGPKAANSAPEIGARILEMCPVFSCGRVVDFVIGFRELLLPQHRSTTPLLPGVMKYDMLYIVQYSDDL